MKNAKMSLVDAFIALDDMDDEAVRTIRRHLHEGKSFNVQDGKEMEAAKAMREEEKAPQSDELEVIDVNADTLDHLKDKKEYVGQMLLQCRSCKATKFVDADALAESENEEGVFNIEDECPNCHNTGSGFTLVGQVGKVASEKEEPEEEPKLDNDEKQAEGEEPKLDNDEAELPTEETPEEEPATETSAPVEETPVDDTADELNYDETNAEDDTLDLDSGKLGDENVEDFEWDDTEELPVEEEKPEEEKSKEIKKEELEDEKESLTEEVKISTVKDFFDYNSDPAATETVVIKDTDGNELYSGDYMKMPEEFLDDVLVGAEVEGSVSVTLGEGPAVKSLLNDIKEAAEVFVDDESAGDLEAAKETKGSENYESWFTNGKVTLTVQHNEPVSQESSLDEAISRVNPVNELVKKIVIENALYDDPWTIHWLTESLLNRENLNQIKEKYINKNLLKEFLLAADLGDDEEECRARAEEMLEKNSKVYAVIYGYVAHGGKFHCLPQPRVCRDFAELRSNTEAVELRYRPVSVRVVYGKEPGSTYEEELKFKDRKSLAAAITECKNNKQPYSVKRSLEEGYRFVLVKLPCEDCFDELTDEQCYGEEECNPYVNPEQCAPEECCPECGDEPCTCEEEPECKVCPVCGKEVCECKKVLKESPDEVINVAPEDVIEPAENEVTPAEPETAVMNPEDQEIVDKILRIANDTADAIRDSYGIEADPRLIAADIIQDLRLVSGALRPEDLADTPINNLTREMYQAYNGFMDAVDELESFETGEPITRDEARNLRRSIAMLDSPNYSTPAIQQAIASPQFQIAMQRGQVPAIGQQPDVRRLPHVHEALTEAKHLNSGVFVAVGENIATTGKTVEQLISSIKAEASDFPPTDLYHDHDYDYEVDAEDFKKELESKEFKEFMADADPEYDYEFGNPITVYWLTDGEVTGDDILIVSFEWDQTNEALTEAIEDDDDEYLENAKEFCDEISTMSLEDVDKWLTEYGFDKNAPEDEAEEMIYHALTARKVELSESLTEEESYFETLKARRLSESSGIPAGPQHSEEQEKVLAKVEKEIEKQAKNAPVPEVKLCESKEHDDAFEDLFTVTPQGDKMLVSHKDNYASSAAVEKVLADEHMLEHSDTKEQLQSNILDYIKKNLEDKFGTKVILDTGLEEYVKLIASIKWDDQFKESITEAKKDELIDKVTDNLEKIQNHVDLIDDEIEAAENYDDAIKAFEDSKVKNKEEIISRLHHIKGEELEHIDELEEISDLLPKMGELSDEPEVVPEEPTEEPVDELPDTAEVEGDLAVEPTEEPVEEIK